ncbi:MAG: DsbA family protein [Solirubrobacteraceae bacterium]|nr:DsbA family protein [Solirubrobacteraceae bacterium]
MSTAYTPPNPNKRRNVMIAGLVAVVVVVAAVLILVSSGDNANENAAPAANAPLRGVKETNAMLKGIPQDGNALGEKNAPVTMIEYADYQCPFCRDYALETMPILINDYVRSGKLRLEFEPLTFIGPDSETAARAGVAAGQQNLEWNYTHLFFFNQGEERSGYVTDALIDKLYAGAGVNAAKANAYRKTPAAAVPIAEASANAQKYGVASTPSFVVGPTGGPYTKLDVEISNPDAFKAAFDALLK